MSRLTKVSRLLAPLLSLSLLAGYVVYSHQSMNPAKHNAENSGISNDSLSRLLLDDDLSMAAFNPTDLRHQMQPMMADRVIKDALPREGSGTAAFPVLNVPTASGSLFELDGELLEATKSETLSLLFPLRLSQAFHSVPRPDDRTWIRPEAPFASHKGLMEQLADPEVVRTLLVDGGTSAARSGWLAKHEESWNQGRRGEPPVQTSVAVTDYPESGPPTPERIAPASSVMMASSKSGAVRFFFGFVPPKPPLFPRPLVNDPKAMDPKVVEAILNDNGTALAKSGRLLTPETLHEKIEYRLKWPSTLMSSSKGGPVFLPPLFDLTPPLLKTDMSIQP